MNRDLTGQKPHFRPVKKSANPYRLLLWGVLILASLWLLLQLQRGQMKPLFLPTPTPTRTASSFALEGEAQFQAGNIDGSIEAYQKAVEIEPGNARAWAELARVQTYSSSLLSTDQERFERMQEARQSIDQAVAANPDDAYAHAIRSLVLDWYAASSLLSDTERQTALNEAEAASVRALQLDSENALALAFFAEILVDQQKWQQAEQTIQEAASIDANSMDLQRVYGYVLESLSQYRLAIEKYQEAARIAPNLTFLYIFIGRNFLTLNVHQRALEEFERAAKINEQLGIKDPVPYIEIAKTYVRDGEFFAAALNGEKALSFDPTNPNTYGQLGTIYTKARNFESARYAFQCAVRSCSADENQVAKEILGEGVDVLGMPLTSGTVAFYYVQYGSVLAALSRPNQNLCPEALSVMDEVRAKYPDDPIFKDIIAENINICNLIGQPLPTSVSPTPTLNPTP
jgi:tetratricopeptide (TPR) repeat protein